MERPYKVHSKRSYDYTNFLVTPDDSYTETMPDLNISIKRLLQDFTRDPFEFVNDSDDNDYLPGVSYPSVDPLTDADDIREEFSMLSTKLSNTDGKQIS